MAEHAQQQVLGFLNNARQAAANEVDAARINFEGAQNRLATAEEYLRSVDEQLAHHRGTVTHAH
jgi:hypothetical protein